MERKIKKSRWRGLISYYKPYAGLFAADMVFAIIGAAVTLAIPLIVRYITTNVVFLPGDEAITKIIQFGLLMALLVVIEFGCNFFITYYGHLMGTYMERDLRNEIFEHYQRLSLSFFDSEKVGHLLSRVTADLFDMGYIEYTADSINKKYKKKITLTESGLNVTDEIVEKITSAVTSVSGQISETRLAVFYDVLFTIEKNLTNLAKND